MPRKPRISRRGLKGARGVDRAPAREKRNLKKRIESWLPLGELLAPASRAESQEED